MVIDMSKPAGPEVISYAGGAVSIASSLTLTEVGVIVGIATALLTFILNVIYMYRKDRREQAESMAALRRLGSGDETD